MQEDLKRQRCPECGTPDVRVIQTHHLDAMGHVTLAISAECPSEACMWHTCAEPPVGPVALNLDARFDESDKRLDKVSGAFDRVGQDR
jgi:hypothetical protein